MTLPAPAPDVDEVSADFWAATATGRLILKRCDACQRCMWYPRSKCPFCHSFEVSWIDAAGTGAIYSYTVTTRGMDDFAGIGEYVLAYVELDEGPRILTNIVGCPLESLDIGQRVEVTFHDTGAGSALPRFRPIAGSTAGTT
jgi:uncharacterized protein